MGKGVNAISSGLRIGDFGVLEWYWCHCYRGTLGQDLAAISRSLRKVLMVLRNSWPRLGRTDDSRPPAGKRRGAAGQALPGGGGVEAVAAAPKAANLWVQH